MPRNVEIKARARNLERQERLARGLSGGEPEHLEQEDVFFHAPRGRLKLRVFGDGSGELIQYRRSDAIEPSESRYVRAPTSEPSALREALANALGERAVVRKCRTVYLCGQTRIHLDRVEGLGEFLELEVVLEAGQPFDQGVAVARELMAALEIDERDLIERAYVDLLEEEG